MPDWPCPTRRNSHSCDKQTVEALFAERLHAVKLYRRVRKALEAIGPVEVAVTRTQVAFRAEEGLRFCWVGRPPKGVKGIPEFVWARC